MREASALTTPFILLATQRSGSSWVQETLNTHPGVKVYTELFIYNGRDFPFWEPNDVEFANTFWEKHDGRPRRLTRPYTTVRYLRRVLDQPDCGAVGFKYMYDQIRRSRVVLPYAAAARIKVVHLVRVNLLDVLVSSRLAETTRVWGIATDGRPQMPWTSSTLAPQKITLDPDFVTAELARLSKERERARAWLSRSRTPTCEVHYETLAADRSAFGTILDFLELPDPDPTVLRSPLKKIRTAPVSEVIENFAEVRASLLGTPFEVFLPGEREIAPSVA